MTKDSAGTDPNVENWNDVKWSQTLEDNRISEQELETEIHFQWKSWMWRKSTPKNVTGKHPDDGGRRFL